MQLEFFGRFHVLDADEKGISFSVLDQFIISDNFLPHSTIATDCVWLKNQQGHSFWVFSSADNVN